MATEGQLSLEEIAGRLQISKGNASMSLRELRTFGVVRQVEVPGDRRDFYVTEPDVWTMFFRILKERKRREFDPALEAIHQLLERPGAKGEDLARLAVEQGASRATVTMDAVGPEAFGFDELVRLVRRAVGSPALVTTVPAWLLLLASRLLRPVVGDVVLTVDEVEGLRANLLVSHGSPTGSTRFTEWLGEHAKELGTSWASELARHFK